MSNLDYKPLRMVHFSAITGKKLLTSTFINFFLPSDNSSIKNKLIFICTMNYLFIWWIAMFTVFTLVRMRVFRGKILNKWAEFSYINKGYCQLSRGKATEHFVKSSFLLLNSSIEKLCQTVLVRMDVQMVGK